MSIPIAVPPTAIIFPTLVLQKVAMDLDFTPEDIAFRDEVRAFVVREYPSWLRDKSQRNEPLEREDYVAWMRILAGRGWLAWSWPKQFGGPGWTPTQRYIFKEELANAGTIPIFSMGVMMCGPVVQRFGTAEQQARFLPAMTRAESWWCQGYSEPAAGSDLASLKTRAERFTADDGREYYRVNGQKTWTTLAQHADWGFFLVRTDPAAKPQRGISFLLIDMASPGITIRPIETLGGEREVNEVWLDDVIVPAENRIHNENEGWTCAKYLLEHERSNVAEVARSKKWVQDVRSLAVHQVTEDGTRLIDQPAFRRKIAQIEIDLQVLEMTELRALSEVNAGRDPGPLMSLLKTKGSELQQAATELGMEAAGPYGFIDMNKTGSGTNWAPEAWAGLARAADRYLNMRKSSIYGGSNEIQRGIIAKHALGL